jgi:hypothetical protein
VRWREHARVGYRSRRFAPVGDDSTWVWRQFRTQRETATRRSRDGPGTGRPRRGHRPSSRFFRLQLTEALKQMSSSTIQVFCTRLEIQHWLAELMDQKELAALPMTLATEERALVAVPADLCITPSVCRVFLFPVSSFVGPLPTRIGEAAPRKRGWVDCQVGGETLHDGNRVLAMTTVTGEDFELETVHPARFVRSLKRRLAKSTRAGAVAIGTDVHYKSMRYTAAAARLAEEGVLWKTSPAYSAVFGPSDPGDLGEE